MNKYYYFYKLECNDCDDVYIGKTTCIYSRLISHRYRCMNINSPTYNCKVYTFIRANGGWENWLMYIIDEGEYSKEESKKIERKYIEKYGTLNHYLPGRSKKESQKEYYLKNTDKIKAYQKEYNRQYRLKNINNIKAREKEYKKEYYKKNKQRLDAYRIEYRKKNKK